MGNSYGKAVSLTLFGESHGAEIGAVVDGLPAGIAVDEAVINRYLERRRPAGVISTARREADRFRIVSGVYGGRTNGEPLCILIPNGDTRSTDYERFLSQPRPGHADFTSFVKYKGFGDYRGGGHFSGRLTAPLTAVGAVLVSALRAKGIETGAHIYSIGDIKDKPFASFGAELSSVRVDFPVLDAEAGERMCEYIAAAAADGDSVGGVIETAVIGVPAGVGEPWFDGVESALAAAVFGIPGVKGIEFGAGFDMTRMKGSEANDPFELKDGNVVTLGNNNGGINGGISNGMPIVFRTAVKPTPSIAKTQNTLNLKSGKREPLNITGRHDPAIVHRAVPVVEAVTALVLVDLLAQTYGRNWLAETEKKA